MAVHLFLHTAVQVPAIKPYFHRLPFGWLFARKAGPLKSRVLFLTTDLVQIFRYFDHPAIQGPISYWATYVLSHLSTSSLSFSNYLLHPGFQLRRLTKVDPCVDPRSDHGLGGQAQGGWNIVRQWDPILWLTTLTLGALQLEKWTKTKLQAWYTLSLHLLDITLTLYFCFFLWYVWYVFYVEGSVFKHSRCYLIIIQLSSPICQLSLRSWQLLPMPWPRKVAVIVFGHYHCGNRGSFPRMSYLAKAPCRSSRHGGGGWLKSKDLRPSVKAMLATLGNLQTKDLL